MAIAFSAVTGAQGSSNTATVTAPSVASGDLIVLVVSKDINGDGSPNFPSGFTPDHNLINTGPDTQQFYVGHKVAAGTETSLSVTWGGSARDWRIACLVYTGVDTTTPLDIAVPTGSVNNSGNSSPFTVTHATLTTVTDGAMVVWLVGIDSVATSVSVSGTPPSDYTERLAQGHTSGWAGIYVADHTYATAGATGSIAGSVSVSSGNSGWAVGTLVLRPASGGGGSGAMIGSASFGFTPSGSMGAGGTLAGVTALAFSGSAAGKGAGALAGAAPVTFSPAATASGSGELSAVTIPTFSLSATLTAAGTLEGQSPLAFSPAGAIAGLGALAASQSLEFALSGTLIALGSGSVAGSCDLTFSASGTLSANGVLAGVSAMSFGTSAPLTMNGFMTASASLGFSTSGSIQGGGVLAGTAVLAFTATASYVGSFQSRIVYDAVTTQPRAFDALITPSSYFEQIGRSTLQ